jgi:hypothetical protein
MKSQRGEGAIGGGRSITQWPWLFIVSFLAFAFPILPYLEGAIGG